MTKEDLSSYMRNHTIKEAAKHFGVGTATIDRRLKKYDLKYYDLKYGHYPRVLNETQNDIVIGTILGDASFSSSGYYVITQKLSSKEYVEYIFSAMKPFTCHFSNDNKSITRTITSPIFKTLRKKWYIKGIKTVPRDLQLNAKSLSHWFCDDGYLLAKRKRIELATNGFVDEDVKFLISVLKRDLNIDSGLHRDNNGRPIIRVKTRCFSKFLETVKPCMIWKCFDYKVDLSEMPQTKKGWGANKLGLEKALQIRKIYYTSNYSQASLAKMFGISCRMVWLIVNNKAHVVYPDMGFGGSADVKVTFNRM